MNAQEIFNQAYQHYQNATGILGQFGNMLEEATNGNFTSEVALVEFDCILQYILLYGAVSDGRISKYEQQFMAQITDRGDILVALSNKLGKKITWDSLEGMDADTGIKLLSLMTPAYSEVLQDFCGSVAKADGIIKEIDLFELINESILSILGALAHIDGQATEDEINVLCGAYIDLFVQYYKNAVAEGESL